MGKSNQTIGGACGLMKSGEAGITCSLFQIIWAAFSYRVLDGGGALGKVATIDGRWDYVSHLHCKGLLEHSALAQCLSEIT
jgi:hypothetical protein